MQGHTWKGVGRPRELRYTPGKVKPELIPISIAMILCEV
jgi:hypothetical protein